MTNTGWLILKYRILESVHEPVEPTTILVWLVPRYHTDTTSKVKVYLISTTSPSTIAYKAEWHNSRVYPARSPVANAD
ncbi:hypothetical protein EAF00_006035 [Botryotinia globosa]|nr:hypothetical protein EAF00_006035 [Botryotinia globosa]